MKPDTNKQKTGSAIKKIMIFIGLILLVFALLFTLVYVIPGTSIFRFDNELVSY